MSNKNVAITQAYYTAMAEKNITEVAQYLHPDVRLISPFAIVESKEAVVQAAKGFSSLFKTINIRAAFSSDDQVMLTIDFDFPAPIGILRSAILMTFRDGLIIENELFFDTRVLETKKDEVYSQK